MKKTGDHRSWYRKVGRGAFLRYLTALLLFGSNGVIASHNHLSSLEIVLLRSCIGSTLLLLLYVLSERRRHKKAVSSPGMTNREQENTEQQTSSL